MYRLRVITHPEGGASSGFAAWRNLLPLALLLLTPTAQAAPLVFESPAQQVTVLELFTSHGCSSCPPADAWLRKLVNHPALWQRVVPLSLHVDYWNDYGWPDRFSRAEFSHRQQSYYQHGGLSAVYTPGFVLAGREWRDWRRLPSGRLPEFPLGQTVGTLHLEVTPGETARLSFQPATGRNKPLTAHLAVLGFGLSTPIGGGENAGRTLNEEFVVLGTTIAQPSTTGKSRWQLPWPELRAAHTSRQAVAVWLSESGNPRPLQAVGGWLP